SLANIRTGLAGRPDLQALVTPDYPYMGKRPIHDSEFYPSLLRDDVTLVPRAVSHVTEQGIVDADGIEREADVIVLSTGFRASDYLAHLKVYGQEGVEIHDRWSDGATAFL